MRISQDSCDGTRESLTQYRSDSGVHEKLDCFAWADGSGLRGRVSIHFFSWANRGISITDRRYAGRSFQWGRWGNGVRVSNRVLFCFFLILPAYDSLRMRCLMPPRRLSDRTNAEAVFCGILLLEAANLLEERFFTGYCRGRSCHGLR